MNEQLKPCPFCGTEPILDYNEVGGGVSIKMAEIRCPKCKTEKNHHAGLYSDVDVRQKAIDAWNPPR